MVCLCSCGLVYHSHCYIPPLAAAPASDWTCLLCQRKESILAVSDRKESILAVSEQ